MVLVLLVAALAVLPTALVARGRWPRLRAVRLLLVTAVIQLVVAAAWPGSGWARGLALAVTAVLVGLFLYANRAAPGVALIAAGLMANVAVIAVNAAMPVSLTAAESAGLTREELRLSDDPTREPLDADTRLGLLSDRIPVGLPGWPQLVSAGDVLVAAGVGLLLVSGGAPQSPRRIERSTIRDSVSTTTGSYS